jgi:predicted MFS family arabinose efflux permease
MSDRYGERSAIAIGFLLQFFGPRTPFLFTAAAALCLAFLAWLKFLMPGREGDKTTKCVVESHNSRPG